MTRKKVLFDRLIKSGVTKLSRSFKTDLSKKLIVPGVLNEVLQAVSAQTVRKTKVNYLAFKKTSYLGELKNDKIWLLLQIENNYWDALFKSLQSLSRREYKKQGLYPIFIFLFEYLNNHPRKNLILYVKNSVMGAKRDVAEPYISESLFIRYFGLPKNLLPK